MWDSWIYSTQNNCKNTHLFYTPEHTFTLVYSLKQFKCSKVFVFNKESQGKINNKNVVIINENNSNERGLVNCAMFLRAS